MFSLQSLELRCLLAVSVAGHRLSIVGDAAANDIVVGLVQHRQSIRVSVDGVARKLPAASVNSIVIDAGDGNDRVDASALDAARPTLLLGGAGNDTLIGSPGPDQLIGGAGNDSLLGNDGNDTLRGNGGRDFLDGGAGKDNLAGNAGADRIVGGTGIDTFHDADSPAERVDQTSRDHVAADANNAATVAWSAINDFTYQLQNADLVAIGQTKFDLAVIDANDNNGTPYTPQQIAALQHSLGGEKRVLAYLSIGEAENYRSYWNPAWDANNDGTPDPAAPAWLGPVNPDWPGNYKVKYWDPAWQRIIRDEVFSRVAQGFDGVYLDIVDAFEFWGPDGNNQRPSAEQDMVDFVKTIAADARAVTGKSSFAIVPQNGEALGRHADYLATITAIGHEDVFYNGDTANQPADVTSVVADLDLFKAAGKPVFIIDYAKKLANIDRIYTAAGANGYVAYCPRRDLDALTINPGHEPN